MCQAQSSIIGSDTKNLRLNQPSSACIIAPYCCMSGKPLLSKILYLAVASPIEKAFLAAKSGEMPWKARLRLAAALSADKRKSRYIGVTLLSLRDAQKRDASASEAPTKCVGFPVQGFALVAYATMHCDCSRCSQSLYGFISFRSCRSALRARHFSIRRFAYLSLSSALCRLAGLFVWDSPYDAWLCK